MAAKRESSLLDGRKTTAPDDSQTESGLHGSQDAEGPTIVVDLGIEGLTDVEPVADGPEMRSFRAEQRSTERTVIVRVLHGDPTSATGRQFHQECRVSGRLSGHAGIVPLFQTGLTSGECPYMVTPFYRRGSFAEFIAEHGAISWQQSTYLLESVAVTLSEVHGRGIVHGAIRPSNIMLTDFLLPRVSSFGASMRIGSDDAPGADPWVDVFGMAAVLWSLLTGEVVETRPPATGDDDEQRAVTTPAPILDLIDRSMCDEPERRPPNAAAFVTELRRAVGDAGRIEVARSLPAPAPRPVTRSTTAGQINTAAKSTARRDRTGDQSATDQQTAGQDGAGRVITADRSSADPATAQTTTGNTTTDRSSADLRTAGTSADRSGAELITTGGETAGTSTGARTPTGGREAGDGGAPSSHQADVAGSIRELDESEVPLDAGITAPPSDARYILLLVGCIGAVIVVMVAAAMLTVS